MAFAAKTDYLGLARTGLEIVSNADGATNQNLEIPSSNGDIIANEKFGSVTAPSCDYKITGTLANLTLNLGQVYATSATAPIALQSFSIHTGAGEEPTFSANGVQVEANAQQTICKYASPAVSLSPARHAQTFGAVADITESATLTLQTGDFTCEAEIDPTTINGVPKASDAVKGKATVALTLWTNSDSTAPTVTAATGWQQTADWACTGADGAMFVWTATFTKYLEATTPTASAT